MKREIKGKYIKAGEIAQKARKKAREVCKPGESLYNIAETIEKLIRDNGAKPAFPVNVSVNEISAHFTPIEENQVVKESDAVKIDIGVHVDGYIADTALTVNPDGSHSDLIDAVETALSKGIQKARIGTQIGDIGAEIQDSIESRGYKPIRNLGGHYMDRWTQHAGERIPNISTGNVKKLQNGDAIAIEPFATEGSGKVKETKPGNIYRYVGGKTRRREERKILKIIKSEFHSLPFTPRWIDMPEAKLRMAMDRLVQKNIIHSYPILKEVNGKTVTQAEHTVLVEEDPVVTTREPDQA